MARGRERGRGSSRRGALPWRPSVAIAKRRYGWGVRIQRLVARVVDGRVVLTIQGAAAIARIFPTVPDSVTLIRRRPGTDEEEITIVVERSQP